MATVEKLLSNNIDELFKIRKLGIKQIDTITDYYSIYQVYKGFSEINSQMLRYQYTAEKCKVSVESVRKVVALMRKVV